MPVLPLIDLLILLGTGSLATGALLKAIWITTAYRPSLFGFSPTDFATIAAVFLLLALTLAARTWVKLNEGRILAAPRTLARARRAAAQDYDADEGLDEEPVALRSGERH